MLPKIKVSVNVRYIFVCTSYFVSVKSWLCKLTEVLHHPHAVHMSLCYLRAARLHRSNLFYIRTCMWRRKNSFRGDILIFIQIRWQVQEFCQFSWDRKCAWQEKIGQLCADCRRIWRCVVEQSPRTGVRKLASQVQTSNSVPRELSENFVCVGTLLGIS